MASIKTKRCFLRQVESADIQHVFKGLSNPKVTKYYAVHFDTLEATKEQMDWYDNLVNAGSGIWFVIGLSTSDELIGAIGFNDQNKQSAEIGYWLLPEYWGQGYISEVLPIAIDFGFNQLRINQINAFVEAGNDGSAKILISNGFQEVKIDQEEKKGNTIDVICYSKYHE